VASDPKVSCQSDQRDGYGAQGQDQEQPDHPHDVLGYQKGVECAAEGCAGVGSSWNEPRSGGENVAQGASPGVNRSTKSHSPEGAKESLAGELAFPAAKSLSPFQGCNPARRIPGAYAPGFILAAASRLVPRLYLAPIACSTSSAVCGRLPVRLTSLPS
jgi:hypothetical protein